MTIKEFFENEEKLGIHCNTKEKAIKLLKAFDRNGYKWHDGDKFTDETYWNIYEENTCYFNNSCYGCKNNKKHKILEFEDIEDIEDAETQQHKKYYRLVGKELCTANELYSKWYEYKDISDLCRLIEKHFAWLSDLAYDIKIETKECEENEEN